MTDYCECREKGIKVHTWDMDFAWITDIQPDGKKHVTHNGYVHRDCGKEVKQKSFDIPQDIVF